MFPPAPEGAFFCGREGGLPLKGSEQQSRFTFDKTQSITPRENDSGNLKEKNFLWGVVSLKGSEQLTRPTVAAKKFYDHA